MKIQTTKVYSEIDGAVKNGYTTISEQGASRSGKTRNTVIYLVVFAMTHPRKVISVVRATRPALTRSVFRDFKEVLFDMGFDAGRMINKSSLTISFDNGSFIEFFSTDDEQKLRGSKRNVLYVNEANELKEIEWQQLKMRTTEFSIIDYNPSFTEDHWICSVNQDKRTYHFITTYKDNPFLEQTIIDEIESLQWKNPALWKVYGLGEMAIVEGLVFPKYEVVSDFPTQAKRRYVGMDFGYSSDPTAIVDVAIVDDMIYIDEICYQTAMKSGDIIRELKEHNRKEGRKFEIISESADPRLVDEIYDAGLNIKPVHKYAGSIKAGIMKMQEMRLIVTERSANIIKELKNYTYQKDKNGKWLDEPVDYMNHCFTADTFVMTDNGGKRITEVKEGDMVLTTTGYRRVTRFFDNGLRTVYDYTMTFSDGSIVELSATPEHKVKVSSKNNILWKELSKLEGTEMLFVCSTGRNTTNTRMRGIGQEVEIGCMSSCGDSLTEVSQKDSIYTTETKTRTIIKSKISNAYQRKNTVKFILKKKNAICHTKKIRGKEWIMREYTHRYGIKVKKGGLYIGKSDSSHRKTQRIRHIFANVVGRNLNQGRQETIQNSVQIIASQNIGEIKESTTSKRRAKCVDVCLSTINIQGKNAVQELALTNLSAKSKRKEHVYDIEVEDAHEFFANGVCVHNCMDATRYVVLEKVLGYRTGMSASQIAEIL